MAPIVSVSCTFLNADDTLGATLASLRDQTATEARFILVDDGSSDRSVAIAERYTSADARFQLHRNPQPGRGRALNLAVDRSDCEYVAILDADDLAHPDWLGDAIHAMRENPQFAVISFNRIYIRDNERPHWSAGNEAADRSVADVTRELARANVLAHSGTVIRRTDLREVGGYDAARDSLFDYDLWIRLVEAGHRVGLSSLVRIAKRYHGGQKFAHRRGYSLSAWRDQYRAIMAIDPSYANFLRLGWRAIRDVARRPRQAVAAMIRRR